MGWGRNWGADLTIHVMGALSCWTSTTRGQLIPTCWTSFWRMLGTMPVRRNCWILWGELMRMETRNWNMMNLHHSCKSVDPQGLPNLRDLQETMILLLDQILVLLGKKVQEGNLHSDNLQIIRHQIRIVIVCKFRDSKIDKVLIRASNLNLHLRNWVPLWD